MNYCLSYSSVGFYQVAKLFCIPMTLLLESMFGLQQEKMTLRLIVCLVLIVVGMMMIIREEITTNFTGFIWGFCGVVATAGGQVFFGPLKKGLALDSFQLLFHTSPWLTFGSFVSVPIFENTESLINYDLKPGVVQRILMTCALAVAFNVSNYLVLSSISPLSYNIMGHVKTIVIISVGSYLFGTVPSFIVMLGMGVTILGVLLFSLEKELQSYNNSINSNENLASVSIKVKHSSIDNAVGISSSGLPSSAPALPVVHYSPGPSTGSSTPGVGVPGGGANAVGGTGSISFLNPSSTHNGVMSPTLEYKSRAFNNDFSYRKESKWMEGFIKV
jgi:solute carrier family 35, member E3